MNINKSLSRVFSINPTYSSMIYLKYGEKMKESDYRTLRYEKCVFEEHYEYVSILNLYGRDTLNLLTVRQMKGKKHSDNGDPP